MWLESTNSRSPGWNAAMTCPPEFCSACCRVSRCHSTFSASRSRARLRIDRDQLRLEPAIGDRARREPRRVAAADLHHPRRAVPADLRIQHRGIEAAEPVLVPARRRRLGIARDLLQVLCHRLDRIDRRRHLRQRRLEHRRDRRIALRRRHRARMAIGNEEPQPVERQHGVEPEAQPPEPFAGSHAENSANHKSLTLSKLPLSPRGRGLRRLSERSDPRVVRARGRSWERGPRRKARSA